MLAVLAACAALAVAAPGAQVDWVGLSAGFPEVSVDPAYHAYHRPGCEWVALADSGTPDGNDSLPHFRAWLRERHSSIDKLNAAWGRSFTAFDEINLPTAFGVDVPSRDWLDFRCRARAERLAEQYQIKLSGKQSGLALARADGDMLAARPAARMAAMPDLYSSVSDGLAHDGSVPAVGPEFPNLIRSRAGAPMLEAMGPLIEHMYPIRPHLGVYLSRQTWSLLGPDQRWRELRAGLNEQGIPMTYLYDSSEFSSYRIVFSINNDIVHSAAAQKLRQYVNDGGTLVVCGRFFERDEDLKPRPPLFGWSVEGVVFPGGSYLRQVGQGKVVLLEEPKNAEDLMNKVTGVLRSLGGLPNRRITEVGTDGIRGLSIDQLSLTDGLNFLQVITNPSDFPVTLKTALDPDLLPKAAKPYAVEVRGEETQLQRTGDNWCQLTLPAKGTAAVAWLQSSTEEEAKEALAAAEERSERLGSALTEYSSTYLAAARAAVEREDYPKAVAHSARAASALGIKTEFFRQGRERYLRVSVLDARGEVTDATLSVTLRPGFEKPAKAMRAEGGEFLVPLGPADLPRVYNNTEGRYEQLSEPFCVYLTARRGGEMGARRLVIGDRLRTSED